MILSCLASSRFDLVTELGCLSSNLSLGESPITAAVVELRVTCYLRTTFDDGTSICGTAVKGLGDPGSPRLRVSGDKGELRSFFFDSIISINLSLV